MSATPRTVHAGVEVALDPAAAFERFTAGIGDWWRDYWNDAERAVGLRLEPGVGGRLVEVHDVASGDGFEVGRVIAWEPGRRLAVGWRESGWEPEEATEVEVGFAPAAGGTRVELVHRGWERVASDPFAGDGYDEGWAELLGWFAAYAESRRGD